MVNSEDSQIELQTLLNEHHEWLLIHALGRSFPLQNTEIEIEFAQNKLLFSYLDDKGFQTWRVNDFKFEAGEIRLNLSRNFRKEHEKIRLVPRTSAKDLSENLELARLEKANKIAAIINENYPKIKIVRVELNQENGRFAQIFLENQTLVLADVSDSLTPEILISAACFSNRKFGARRKNPVGTIWILAEKKQARNLQKLHALLCESWKRKIQIKVLEREKGKGKKEKFDVQIQDCKTLEIKDLWRGKAKEIKSSGDYVLSEAARKIIEVAPEEIDAVFSKNGETLRFQGLPFARVRKNLTEEKVWFGVEKSKQILAENNLEEFGELIENLQQFRRFDAPNKRHIFHTLAPEAWLESILRRNINLLDGNLILAPLYHQFRAERDKIDLLALRKDGRLAIIELKAATDREMIFQAAEYWRKIEFLRRKDVLQKANLFGNAKISDAPTILYLAAPTLCFHRDFEFLKSVISPEIEIFRFDLNENWREKIRILQRR